MEHGARSMEHGEIIYGGTSLIEDDCSDTFSEFIFPFPPCSCSVWWFLIGWQCWNIKCQVKFWFKQLDWFGKCRAHVTLCCESVLDQGADKKLMGILWRLSSLGALIMWMWPCRPSSYKSMRNYWKDNVFRETEHFVNRHYHLNQNI